MFLLDVNVLIALVDPEHEHHHISRAFFREECRSKGWATCAITENAVLRILGHCSYPNTPNMTPREIRPLLQRLYAQAGHTFFDRSPSIMDTHRFPAIPASKHLTDIFLLATAVMYQCSFVSFDRRIDSSILPGGTQAYLLLSPQ